MSDMNIDANCTFSYLHIYQKRTVELLSSKMKIGSVAIWSRLKHSIASCLH